LPDFGTWPCDEINYIWRHGNRSVPTDEFRPEQATAVVKRTVRRAFERQAKRQNVRYVVEKTCANSLRVGFVDAIVPEAKYIFLVRDGRDVVASAQKRWTAALDLPYVLRKARFVPVRDMPYYAARYAYNRLHRLTSRQQQLAYWGPRFCGMDEALATRSLPVVCALQWLRSIEQAERDFIDIDAQQVCRLRYEDLVQNPARAIRRILDFLAVQAESQKIRNIGTAVVATSVGKWRTELSSTTLHKLQPLMEPTLDRWGYVW
jgi:hypothetical protein